MTIIKRVSGAVAAWVCCSMAPFASAAPPAKQIKIMLFEFQPYAGPDLPSDGFTADIVITAFKRAGYQVEYAYFPWRRGLDYLASGTWDVLINVYYTKERAAAYAYPKNHIAISRYTLFALKERTDIPEKVGPGDIASLKIGLVDKASYGETFDALKDSFPNAHRENLRERNLLQMLFSKRIDIMPCDEVSGWYFVKKLGTNPDLVRTVKSDLFEARPLYPVFTRKNPRFAQFTSDWDKSIEKMIRDGSLAALYRKHGVAYER